jgi:hypothetical protein
MCRIKYHLSVKSSLYRVRIIEQACVVISPTSYPVLHHFPIVRADVVHGLGNDRSIIVAASMGFRRSCTDRTRTFEVVPFPRASPRQAPRFPGSNKLTSSPSEIGLIAQISPENMSLSHLNIALGQQLARSLSP